MAGQRSDPKGQGTTLNEGNTAHHVSGGIFLSSLIQGHDFSVHLPATIMPALSGLPAVTPTFTGRDSELIALLTALAPHTGRSATPNAQASEPSITVVSGIAGIGKTELALQATHSALASGWFPGGALFVDLMGHDPSRYVEAGQALAGLLGALSVPARQIPRRLEDRSSFFAFVLSAFAEQGRPIMLVIDDAASYEHAEPLLPADELTGVIMTSRARLGGHRHRLMSLGKLNSGEAMQLLLAILKLAHANDARVSSIDDAIAITTLCDGLPLAIRIIGALLAENPARPLAAMVDDLRDEHTRLDYMSYPGGSIRALFDLSYKHLDPVSARLFRLLSANPGSDISTQAAAALADEDQQDTEARMERLSHLVEHGAANDRWVLNDLVRLYSSEHGSRHAEEDARAAALTRLRAIT